MKSFKNNRDALSFYRQCLSIALENFRKQIAAIECILLAIDGCLESSDEKKMLEVRFNAESYLAVLIAESRYCFDAKEGSLN